MICRTVQGDGASAEGGTHIRTLPSWKPAAIKRFSVSQDSVFEGESAALEGVRILGRKVSKAVMSAVDRKEVQGKASCSASMWQSCNSSRLVSPPILDQGRAKQIRILGIETEKQNWDERKSNC